jgi:acyl carrier protein
MGLDMVEFVMEIEEAFSYQFRDEDMAALTTAH